MTRPRSAPFAPVPAPPWPWPGSWSIQAWRRRWRVSRPRACRPVTRPRRGSSPVPSRRIRFKIRAEEIPQPSGGTLIVRRGIHRQAGHVGTDGAARFGLKHDGVVRAHLMPASRRIRLPRFPASFLVSTVIQTSRPVAAFFQRIWLPLPCRSGRNPAFRNWRMTSAHVTTSTITKRWVMVKR